MIRDMTSRATNRRASGAKIWILHSIPCLHQVGQFSAWSARQASPQERLHEYCHTQRPRVRIWGTGNRRCSDTEVTSRSLTSLRRWTCRRERPRKRGRGPQVFGGPIPQADPVPTGIFTPPRRTHCPACWRRRRRFLGVRFAALSILEAQRSPSPCPLLHVLARSCIGAVGIRARSVSRFILYAGRVPPISWSMPRPSAG